MQIAGARFGQVGAEVVQWRVWQRWLSEPTSSSYGQWPALCQGSISKICDMDSWTQWTLDYVFMTAWWLQLWIIHWLSSSHWTLVLAGKQDGSWRFAYSDILQWRCNLLALCSLFFFFWDEHKFQIDLCCKIFRGWDTSRLVCFMWTRPLLT